MADAKDKKIDVAKSTSKEIEQDDVKDLEAEAAQRDTDRSESDRNQQQDLDQGMDTGTHDSPRQGINWDGPEWQIRSTGKPKDQKTDEPDKKTPSK